MESMPVEWSNLTNWNVWGACGPDTGPGTISSSASYNAVIAATGAYSSRTGLAINIIGLAERISPLAISLCDILLVILFPMTVKLVQANGDIRVQGAAPAVDYILSEAGDMVFRDCKSGVLLGDPGTELSTREHGSGLYMREKQVMETNNR